MPISDSFFHQAEQVERKLKENDERGTCCPQGQGTVRGQDATRVEIWIRPTVHPGVASCIKDSKSGNNLEQGCRLRALSASDVSAASHLHLNCSLYLQILLVRFCFFFLLLYTFVTGLVISPWSISKAYNLNNSKNTALQQTLKKF